MRRRLGFCVGVAVCAAVVLAGAAPASARAEGRATVRAGGPFAAGTSEEILDYRVDIRIEDSGALRIAETIRYDFGAYARHGIYRDVPVRFDYPRVCCTVG